jgi:hypothetical protein
MLRVNNPAACPCPCCMSMSILQVHVYAASRCPCCKSMSILHFHFNAACLCLLATALGSRILVSRILAHKIILHYAVVTFISVYGVVCNILELLCRRWCWNEEVHPGPMSKVDLLNIPSTSDVKFGSLHSLPTMLPGLAWLVPDLGADPKF